MHVAHQIYTSLWIPPFHPYTLLLDSITCLPLQTKHASVTALTCCTTTSWQGHVTLVPVCVWVDAVGLKLLLEREDVICVPPLCLIGRYPLEILWAYLLQKQCRCFNRLVATVGACFPCRLQYAQPINIHIIVSQFRLQMAMDNWCPHLHECKVFIPWSYQMRCVFWLRL